MKFFLKCFLIGFIFSSVSCKSDSDPKGGLKGTSDGGGGEIELSTEQEIREALPQALQIISAPKAFIAMTTVPGFSLKDLNDQQLRQFSRMIAILQNPSSAAFGEEKEGSSNLEKYKDYQKMLKEKYKYQTLSEYIQLSRFYFLESGSCPALDKENAFASVSKFDIGADICFSIERLKKIPKNDLLKQMTALLVHEVTHLFGADEVIASKFQELTLNGFANLTNSAATSVPIEMQSIFFRAWAQINQLEITTQERKYTGSYDAEKKHSQLRSILINLGQIEGYLESFLKLLDESAHPFHVFYSPKTEEKEVLIATEVQRVLDFLWESAQLSDEELLSEAYSLSVSEQRSRMNTVRKTFNEVIDFYHYERL